MSIIYTLLTSGALTTKKEFDSLKKNIKNASKYILFDHYKLIYLVKNITIRIYKKNHLKINSIGLYEFFNNTNSNKDCFDY